MRTDRRNKHEQWPRSHEAACEQNDWHTPVKTLPSLAVGNNKERKLVYEYANLYALLRHNPPYMGWVIFLFPVLYVHSNILRFPLLILRASRSCMILTTRQIGKQCEE